MSDALFVWLVLLILGPLILLVVFVFAAHKKFNLFLALILAFLLLNLLPLPRPSIDQREFDTGEFICREPAAIGLGWPNSYLKYYLSDLVLEKNFYKDYTTSDFCGVPKGHLSLRQPLLVWLITWGGYLFFYFFYFFVYSVFRKVSKNKNNA